MSMGQDSFFIRASELARRAEEKNRLLSTPFLTPAEQEEILSACRKAGVKNVFLSGGQAEAERKRAFFLPDYLSEETMGLEEEIKAFCIYCRFSNLVHRDFLGALIGLGIKRTCIGDIHVFQEEGGVRAYVFVTAQVAPFVSLNLTEVGRGGAIVQEVSLEEVPHSQPTVQETTFTVKSPRLDSVLAGAFGLPRSGAVSAIAEGLCMVNHLPVLKPDQEVREGDVLTVRGKGKAKISGGFGTSRKGRVFITVARYR